MCDEDGLYDPGDFNDRLLLGLKGTMSEAELHFIRARLQGGILSKARRAELQVALPVGLAYDLTGSVVPDPDRAVQQAVALLFQRFARTGSARAVVQEFAREGLQFPTRLLRGPRKGELAWGALRHWRVLRTLHNPGRAGGPRRRGRPAAPRARAARQPPSRARAPPLLRRRPRQPARRRHPGSRLERRAAPASRRQRQLRARQRRGPAASPTASRCHCLSPTSPTVPADNNCCEDRLSPPNTPQGPSPAYAGATPSPSRCRGQGPAWITRRPRRSLRR